MYVVIASFLLSTWTGWFRNWNWKHLLLFNCYLRKNTHKISVEVESCMLEVTPSVNINGYGRELDTLM